MTSKVYIHKCPNGKVYVGATNQRLTTRFNKGEGYKHNKGFYKAIRDFGWENIKHIIMFETEDRDLALDKEIDLIKQYKSNNPKYGYNLTAGGDGGDCWQGDRKMSSETKRKISEAHKGRKRKPFKRIDKKETIEKRRKTIIERGSLKGEKNGMFGKKHSPETIEKIRQKNIEFQKRKKEQND